MSLADSKSIGEQIEGLTIDQISALEGVRERDASIDAVAVDSIQADESCAVYGELGVPEGTEIEIKAASLWISNGSNERTRGRFLLRKGQHDVLVARDAWYCFVVYDGEELLSMVLVPARTVEEFVTWVETTRSHAAVAKVPWPRVLDVDGGEDL